MIPDGKILFSDLSHVLLNSEHDLHSFQCSVDIYTRFLKQDALEAINECTACTHLVYYKEETLVGYFTLINDIIEGGQIDQDDLKPGYRYETYPAMKIARLATHREWEGKNIGKFMLIFSIAYAMRMNQVSACRFITLDAVNDKVSYYSKHGFVAVESLADKKTTPMYLNYSAIVNSSKLSSGQTKLKFE